jgi:asparagine synthase (glutamine-hydrolysing)
MEGQGADEILGGYGDFYWAFLYEQFKVSTIFSFLRQFRAFQRRHHEPWKIILRKWRRLKFPNTIPAPANPVLNARFLLGTDVIPPRPVQREEPTVAELHRNRLTILRYILHNVDRNSMAQSRETRVPYLDYNLVEFCLKLPAAYKISAGLSKQILRTAAKDVLPEKIAGRVDKQGYSSPVPSWAKKELTGFFRENLGTVQARPFVSGKNLIASFDRFVSGPAPFDPVWWRLIAVERWLNIFKLSL